LKGTKNSNALFLKKSLLTIFRYVIKKADCISLLKDINLILKSSLNLQKEGGGVKIENSAPVSKIN